MQLKNGALGLCRAGPLGGADYGVRSNVIWEHHRCRSRSSWERIYLLGQRQRVVRRLWLWPRDAQSHASWIVNQDFE